MLSQQPIMAFVATTDAARAKDFYVTTLGLALVEEDGFALVLHAGGTVVRVQKVEALAPQPFTVLGWHVPDVGAAIAELAARGVVFERYGFLQQDDAGAWTSPSGARVAWFKDPDGNVLSLTQGVPQARA